MRWGIRDTVQVSQLLLAGIVGLQQAGWNLNWPIRIQQARIAFLFKALKCGNCFSLEITLNIDEKGFRIPKTISDCKHETLCVCKLSIWRQKWVTGIRHGNLLVRRVSPGRAIVVLFWTKYIAPCQIKSEILKLTTRRGQNNFSIAFTSVSRENRLLSGRFGRTAKFQLPLVLHAQPSYARRPSI